MFKYELEMRHLVSERIASLVKVSLFKKSKVFKLDTALANKLREYFKADFDNLDFTKKVADQLAELPYEIKGLDPFRGDLGLSINDFILTVDNSNNSMGIEKDLADSLMFLFKKNDFAESPLAAILFGKDQHILGFVAGENEERVLEGLIKLIKNVSDQHQIQDRAARTDGHTSNN